MRAPVELIGLLLLCVLSCASGQTIDYDPRRPQVLRACDEHREHGRTVEARRCYGDLLASASPALVKAEAAWASAQLKEANEFFREAIQVDERSSYARGRWGRLFLATHQYADALKLFGEALQIEPADAQAKLAVARLYAERFEGQARALIDELLKENDALIEAHLIAAGMDLEEGHVDDAERAATKALSLAQAQKRAPLEAYAVLAAVDVLRGDAQARRWINRALAYNPHDGGVFATLAHYQLIRRRYQEATVWLNRAVDVQPDLWSAHEELGVNLLRVGAIEEARAHLQRAYSGDPFSPTTVNTLRLLDTLNEFETEKVAAPDLLLRLHRKEAQALRPYVEQIARRSIETFSRRYGFKLTQPVTVELYPNHDDFAVRTAGLPGIGLLGVTFGYLVAMDSPSGRPPGEFHWASTLWHEMAHVFTLAMTEHRVPRWLSEGVSVYEEWSTGPTPGVAVTPTIIAALRDKRFLPIASLDEGFIRPRYPQQIEVSYVQAGLVCLFIEQRWGFDRLVALLEQFKHETTSVAALQAALKIPSEEFDQQFDVFVRQRFAAVLAQPEGWEQSLRAAAAAAQQQNWSQVIEPARQAIEIFPEHTTGANAHLLLAQALDKTGQRDAAINALQRYRGLGGWDPGALRQLAQWLQDAKRETEAVEVLSALNYVDPLQADGHVKLSEQLLAAGQAADAEREFRVLLALDFQDQAFAKFGIARALKSQGDAQGSRRYLLEALENAPHYRPAQQFLLDTIGERTQ